LITIPVVFGKRDHGLAVFRPGLQATEGWLALPLAGTNDDGHDTQTLLEKGQTVSSSVYDYQLQVGDFISNKKVIQLK